MDPQTQFCHNPDCPARGQLGLDNIRVHSRDVPGRLCLQLLLGSRQSPPAGSERGRSEVAGTNARDGGRSDPPSLDDAGVLGSSDPPTTTPLDFQSE